ncbi:MAG TPA: M13 family metallopeptidase N-terminal domain-containing protein, partial [Chitinophagales bacterium]|nr:M13 family metallopeptidase N-terminal domain-containing protein [Chitinophagales bacterium]
MNIKQFVIPAAFVALAFNASAQSEKTTATKTSTVNTPIKKKNAPIAVPKLSKAQLDTLAKSMAVPLKGMKDPAIKTNELSPTIKPTEDFYEYVNQRWIKGHPIPADKASYGMFDKLNEQSRLVVKRILENAANQKTKPAKGSNLQLLGDFYKSAMDTATINKVGVTPLQGWFSDIEKANTPSALTKVFSRLGMRDINNPIGYTVDVDAKNTTRYIVYIGQGGLGLPDKDFYFRKDEKSQKHLEEYKAYIQT